MLTRRCLRGYFLTSLTFSTRLIPAHSLCSLLVIMQFRPVQLDNPMKNAIAAVSRSPPDRKRRFDDQDQPPNKRSRHDGPAVSTSGIVVNTIPRTHVKVGQAITMHDTFDESFTWEPTTICETELGALYDESDQRKADYQAVVDEAAEVTAADCQTAFEVLDQIADEEAEAEALAEFHDYQEDRRIRLEIAQLDKEAENASMPSLIWDHNHELINLQAATTESGTTSTTTPPAPDSNDSPPSSVPSNPYERSGAPSDEQEHESTSQLTMSVETNQKSTVPTREEAIQNDPRLQDWMRVLSKSRPSVSPTKPTDQGVVLNETNDNATNG